MKLRINIPNWIFLVAGLLLGGIPAAWGIGRQLFENPATETNYASKIASGTPVPGYVPVAGYCTGTETGTGTTDRQCWKPLPSGLPSGGTPGQVAVVTALTTGTSTATGWTVGNGTIFAGSNVRLSTGTNTTTGTSANLSDGPRVHAVGFEPPLPAGAPGQVVCYTGAGTSLTTSKGACAQSTGAAYSFSTSTPVADGTSGAVGTSTSLNRSDHRHKGDGNDKVAAYSGQTPDYLENVVRSSDSSITLAEFSGDIDIRANFGTADNTVCMGNDSRLSNARTPTAHASTHVEGGTDAIAVATQSVDGLMSHEDKLKLDSTSSTPTANYIPVANASGKLDAWIQAASASNAGLLSASNYARINAARDTAGISGVLPLTGSYGYLHQFAPIYANTTCASGSSDVTVTSSETTTLATITVSTSDLTSSGSNRLKLTYHLSGYAIGGAAAIARARVLASNWLGSDKVPCTATVATAANGYAVVMTASCEVWDANWLTYTTSFYLQIDTSSGTLFIPLNTQAGAYSACLTIDGLHSL